MRRKERFAKLFIGLFAAGILLFGKTQVMAFDGEDLTFSRESGYYASSFDLTIEADGVNQILYTLDGSDPVEGGSSTKVYSGSVKVDNLKGKNVVLSTNDNAGKFTVDGWANVPSASKLDRATIVRAVGIKEDGTKTRVSTKTYFINNDIKKAYNGCAVMSIVTDKSNLLDDLTGIYVRGSRYDSQNDSSDEALKAYANFMQSGKEWERAAHMEFFDGDNTALVSTGVGIRIHGGYSRRNQQKSLNIYFRKDYDYGDKNLKGYELIPDATVAYDDEKGEYCNDTLKKYADVMIRNGGNDSDITKFQDVFIQGMVTDKNFTTQGSRPCMVYLNGEYWGLYNLTEKYSDKYIQNKFGVDNNNIIAYKEFELDEGEDPDGAALNELLALGDLDMTKAENYKKFTDLVDVDSFIDYYATEIYINNNDWWSGCNAKTPNNNIMFWRVADPALEVNEDGSVNPYADGKWRYMLYDTEWSMGLYGSREAGAEYDSFKYHALGIPDPQYSTDNGRTEANGSKLFTAVYKNPDFKKQFITAFLDIRNYNFNYKRSVSALEALSDIYSPLMEKHKVRWNNGNISDGVNKMKNFLKTRETYSLTMLETHYSELKNKRVDVTIKSNIADSYYVNTVNPNLGNDWYTGVYYKNYPISLEAKDIEGYSFDGWKITGGKAEDVTSKNVDITLTDNKATIEAVYKDNNGSIPTIAPSPTPAPTETPKPNWGGGWPGWGGWPGSNSDTPTATPKPQTTETPAATATPAPENTKEPEVVHTETPKSTTAPGNSPVSTEEAVKYRECTLKGIVYRITDTGTAIVYKAAKKTIKNAVIPTTISFEGVSYKVVGIGDNAFAGCKKLTGISIGKNVINLGRNAFKGCVKLKKITVHSTGIKKVGSNCFKSVYKKVVIKVPAKKAGEYKRLFIKEKLKKTAVFKKK